MPGIKAQQHNTHTQTSSQVEIQPPNPKKPRINDGPSREGGAIKLRWAIKNRVDYQPPLLRQPYGVAINDHIIVTAEGLWPHSRLQIFDHNGHSQRVIGQGQVLPYDVTVTPEGIIAVTDHYERTVKGFNYQGELKFSWEKNRFVWPNGISIMPSGHFVIADWSQGRVSVCDKASGREISSFHVRDVHQTCCPDRVAVDHHGRIIVSDAFSGEVLLFDVNQQHLGASPFLYQITTDNLRSPKGIAVDSSNDILVADCDENVIRMYGEDGRFIRDVVNADMGLVDPLAIAWNDYRSALIVTEHRLNSSPRMKLFAY